MAAFDYIEAQNDADELLLEFGQSATLQAPGTVTGPSYDPTYGAAISYPCTIAVLDFDARLIDGSLIRYGDKQVYVSAKGLGIAPDPATHTLVIGGVPHAVIPPLSTLAPAGTVVFYVLQARRSGA